MRAMWHRTLFIHRQDLRLHDNIGLHHALTKTREVVHPVFILDPCQCDPEQNKYFGVNSFHFIVESIAELENEVPVTVLHGTTPDVIDTLLRDAEAAGNAFSAVVVNKTYTPFSLNRDAVIRKVCERRGVSFECVLGDFLLHEPEEVQSSTGGCYKKFSPFYNRARALPMKPSVQSWPREEGWAEVEELSDDFVKNITKLKSIESVYDLYPSAKPATRPPQRGGRDYGLTLLGRAFTDLANYYKTRDMLAAEFVDFTKCGSSHLSPHLKMGTVSIREVATRMVKNVDFIRQLFWREFYVHVAYSNPSVLCGQVSTEPNANTQRKYDSVWWDEDKRGVKWHRWITGTTGFPAVDAGMRQLLETGEMHNRARMISASFLTKDLHIHWRRGERFFAQWLTDYDPPSNSGGWQWSSSTGADAQPYFRIFSPWRQLERFDPECAYVRRWIPELKKVPVADILNWISTHKKWSKKVGYPGPMLNHREESALSKKLFQSAPVPYVPTPEETRTIEPLSDDFISVGSKRRLGSLRVKTEREADDDDEVSHDSKRLRRSEASASEDTKGGAWFHTRPDIHLFDK